MGSLLQETEDIEGKDQRVTWKLIGLIVSITDHQYAFGLGLDDKWYKISEGPPTRSPLQRGKGYRPRVAVYKRLEAGEQCTAGDYLPPSQKSKRQPKDDSEDREALIQDLLGQVHQPGADMWRVSRKIPFSKTPLNLLTLDNIKEARAIPISGDNCFDGCIDLITNGNQLLEHKLEQLEKGFLQSQPNMTRDCGPLRFKTPKDPRNDRRRCSIGNSNSAG